MKKVYVLYNWDAHEIIAASEDRNLIEEIMCDDFMYDAYYDFYATCENSNFNLIELHEMAECIWTDMLFWYNDNIEIIEEVLI